jgi:hypothetical protein
VSSSAAARSAMAKVAPAAPDRPRRRHQRRRWCEAGADAEDGGDDGGMVEAAAGSDRDELCGWWPRVPRFILGRAAFAVLLGPY